MVVNQDKSGVGSINCSRKFYVSNLCTIQKIMMCLYVPPMVKQRAELLNISYMLISASQRVPEKAIQQDL